MTENAQQRHVKVTRFRILKPADGSEWKEFATLLRDTRYRTYRLANLAVSEAYLNFHMFRTGRTDEFKPDTIGQLNRRLRDMLTEEKVSEEDLNRFSKVGALPDTVCGALSQYKIRALTSKSKWRQVVRGEVALPTFRRNMAFPIRCDKPDHKRLQRTEAGDVELDLMLCLKPYPRVVLATKDKRIGHGAKTILDRLLHNHDQSLDGYRQRLYEIKHDERDNTWWLFITYDFPATTAVGLNPETIIGVDLGFSCPMYVALNNGHARMGRRQYTSLAARIRSLQRQTLARRRSMLSGGRSNLTKDTARSGHGRKRKLRSIEQLEGRINSAYTTLNHQLSASLIEFAKNHSAGTIQIEDLDGLRETLSGTFLGARWRYHQLQEFIEYKAREAAIEVRRINPKYTSRRCSQCGHINVEFSRSARDAARQDGRIARFVCPECEFTADPDYNAARNIATLDIEKVIKRQCKAQGLSCDDALSQDDREAAEHATLAD